MAWEFRLSLDWPVVIMDIFPVFTSSSDWRIHSITNECFLCTLRNKDEGWEKVDHLRFQFILDQYAADIPNRRSLYVDRMMREMPHLSRHDIVSFHCIEHTLNSND
jgi:hypothetical protein